MTVGTTAIKYANFLFQSPDWGLNSASRNREIRVLLPWIHLHFTQCSPCEKQGDCFDRRNDDGQICKFPLSIPGLGIEFRLRRNREIRVLLPWIHLHFTQCSPCEKQGEFAFIAGTSAINAQISPCNLRSGGCIPASPEPGKFAGCSPGYTCIYRRNVGDKRSNFPLQPSDWGFAPCPRAPSTAEVLLKGEYCITRCKFSGTSKWNPGHARPHLTRGSPSPLMTISALRVLSKSAYTHMRCKKRAGGKKEGRGEKILKKNP